MGDSEQNELSALDLVILLVTAFSLLSLMLLCVNIFAYEALRAMGFYVRAG